MIPTPSSATSLDESRRPTGEEHTSWEMEITGRAEIVRDAAEHARAMQAVLVALILFINGFQDAAGDDVVAKRTIVVRLGLQLASRIYPVIAGLAALTLLLFVAMGDLPVLALLGLAGFPLFVKAARVARRQFASPMELVPANAYTVVGHLASSLALAVGLTWARLGGTATSTLVAVAGLGVLLILYYNRSIGRMARAFQGVKDAVARS